MLVDAVIALVELDQGNLLARAQGSNSQTDNRRGFALAVTIINVKSVFHGNDFRRKRHAKIEAKKLLEKKQRRFQSLSCKAVLSASCLRLFLNSGPSIRKFSPH